MHSGSISAFLSLCLCYAHTRCFQRGGVIVSENREKETSSLQKNLLKRFINLLVQERLGETFWEGIGQGRMGLNRKRGGLG